MCFYFISAVIFRTGTSSATLQCPVLDISLLQFKINLMHPCQNLKLMSYSCKQAANVSWYIPKELCHIFSNINMDLVRRDKGWKRTDRCISRTSWGKPAFQPVSPWNNTLGIVQQPCAHSLWWRPQMWRGCARKSLWFTFIELSPNRCRNWKDLKEM